MFTPGYAQDTVNGFVAGGSGHGVLSLSSADFASIAQVLHDTQNTAGGAVIHDTTSGDTVTLAGITKAQLKANKQDFSFHA